MGAGVRYQWRAGPVQSLAKRPGVLGDWQKGGGWLLRLTQTLAAASGRGHMLLMPHHGAGGGLLLGLDGLRSPRRHPQVLSTSPTSPADRGGRVTEQVTDVSVIPTSRATRDSLFSSQHLGARDRLGRLNRLRPPLRHHVLTGTLSSTRSPLRQARGRRRRRSSRGGRLRGLGRVRPALLGSDARGKRDGVRPPVIRGRPRRPAGASGGPLLPTLWARSLRRRLRWRRRRHQRRGVASAHNRDPRHPHRAILTRKVSRLEALTTIETRPRRLEPSRTIISDPHHKMMILRHSSSLTTELPQSVSKPLLRISGQRVAIQGRYLIGEADVIATGHGPSFLD